MLSNPWANSCFVEDGLVDRPVGLKLEAELEKSRQVLKINGHKEKKRLANVN